MHSKAMPMHLMNQFLENIQKQSLFNKGDRLLVAVSGGLDSVVLCHLCKAAGFDFVMAHCNFQLRGADSDADEQFVQALGKAYQVPVYTKKFNIKSDAGGKTNIQLTARTLRYEWFAECMQSKGVQVNFLLTAHHANDNIETLMMNFFRGTGINGLQGILSKDHIFGMQVVRPLLFATKENLHDYAQLNQLKWREDTSNATNQYTRNYFRNELIPSIQKVFPTVESNLIDNLRRFADVHTLYQQALRMNISRWVDKEGEALRLPILLVKKTPGYATILFEILQERGFTAAQMTDCLNLLDADTGKYVQSSTHRVFKNRKWLEVCPLGVASADNIIIESADAKVSFDKGTLTLQSKEKPSDISVDPHSIQLDAKHIVFPLLLRKWKEGDYFYPLGMNKKKKISRFLIDTKQSLTAKENTWVLESANRLVWVVGQRIDNRFKITEHTGAVLSIHLLSSK